jgi:hypothetical protein
VRCGLIALAAAALAAPALAFVALAPAPAPADPLPATITAKATPSLIHGFGHVTISGTVSGATPGSVVRLYTSPYPYATPTTSLTTSPAPDGSYSFSVSADRNTRYRVDLVELTGTAASASTSVEVIGRTITTVKALPLGRARVRILVFHPGRLYWARAKVSWWFASHRGRYIRATPTRSRILSRYVIAFSTTIALPAGPFRWRACLHVRDAGALTNPRRPPHCSAIGYHGGGFLPYGFPGPGAIARAEGYLSSRAGRTAMAVVDSEGRMSGVHEHWTFITGSVVKAMLLVAYLRHLHDIGQHRVDSNSNSFLYPMIHVSDNSAATQCWSIVGDGQLYALAHAAGMTDFSISGIWANAQLSAADQAKFFFEMDSLIPKEFVGYARFLLSTIAGYESWGIPAVARPLGYQVFFKGGWRGTSLGQLVHQIGRVEGHHRTFSIAVMTDGDPDMGYGINTIQGVTGALLR